MTRNQYTRLLLWISVFSILAILEGCLSNASVKQIEPKDIDPEVQVLTPRWLRNHACKLHLYKQDLSADIAKLVKETSNTNELDSILFLSDQKIDSIRFGNSITENEILDSYSIRDYERAVERAIIYILNNITGQVPNNFPSQTSKSLKPTSLDLKVYFIKDKSQFKTSEIPSIVFLYGTLGFFVPVYDDDYINSNNVIKLLVDAKFENGSSIHSEGIGAAKLTGITSIIGNMSSCKIFVVSMSEALKSLAVDYNNKYNDMLKLCR